MSDEDGHLWMMPQIGRVQLPDTRHLGSDVTPITCRRRDASHFDASSEARAKEILSMDRAGLITDVDGTISRIVSDPALARVDSQIVDAIRELVRHLALVALLSGRSVGQLRQIVDVDRLVYVGNHGLERMEDGRSVLVPEAIGYPERIAKALGHIRREVLLPGIIVEDKGATGTIHYRLCRDHLAARGAVLAASLAAAKVANLRIAEGRKCVNLLPNIPSDKGTAVEALVRGHRLAGVIYLGDDSTDIDAFRALRKMANDRECQVLLIGVCVPESPDELNDEADYCLHGVDAVEGFLRRCSMSLAGRPAV